MVAGSLTAALALVAITGVARAQCPDGTPPPCRPARASGPAPNSVATLYFDNLSRDSSDAYLAEGLTEQVIAQLGSLERLTVASRFAVRRFRGREIQDPATVGRALNVSYLVTGSVQRSGNRLRVGVELLRASTGVRLWGERYDRTETDMLLLQDEIAAAVATGIMGRLLPAERQGLAARYRRSPEAYDHFLRGNFHLARRDASSLTRALREYRYAVSIDPSFVEAMARIAYVYGVVIDGQWDIGESRDSIIARGVATAERALRLDSSSSDAWLSRAYMRMAESPRALDGVRPLFERALALNPRNAEAHHQFAQYLAYLGDADAAARHNMRALELEPGRSITWHQLASLALSAGRTRDGLRFADSALAADSSFAFGHLMRAMGSLMLGDSAGAGDASRALVAASLTLPGLFFDAAIKRSGETDADVATRVLTLLTEPQSATATGSSLGSGFAAIVLAQLGAREEALAILLSAEPGDAILHSLMRWRQFDSMRAEPRFHALFSATRPDGAR